MNIKQKITSFLVAVVVFAGVGLSLMPATASAADCKPDDKKGTICCGTTKTSIIGGGACKDVKDGGDQKSSGIWAILLLVLNIMTAGIGIVAVGGIVYGSVLYSSAGDKAEQTKKAIGVITNVVIGIIAYGLMYIILNFLVPGGIFQ